MINSITVLSEDYKKRIKSGLTHIDLKPGVNFLIGSNGSGKSTLFDLILKGDGALAMGLIDSKFDGPTELRAIRTAENGRNTNLNSAEGINYRHGLMSHFLSHGESLIPVLRAMRDLPDGATSLIDEPEQALDFNALTRLRKLIMSESKRMQFIIATHNPILLSMKANIINIDSNPNYLSDMFACYRKFIG